jgi:hypothetical protein
MPERVLQHPVRSCRKTSCNPRQGATLIAPEEYGTEGALVAEVWRWPQRLKPLLWNHLSGTVKTVP